MTEDCVTSLRDALMRSRRQGMLAADLKALSLIELAAISDDWPTSARDDQLPPHVQRDPDARQRRWHLWLIMGGRGSGKTRAGAEWVRYQLRGQPPLAHQPAGRIALVGPTYHEAAAVMVEGVSGMLAVMGLLPEAVKPTGGSIRLAGRDLLSLDAKAMQDVRGREIGIYVVYPSRKHLSVKVRVLVDFLVEAFAAPAWRE